jgi:predicted permease
MDTLLFATNAISPIILLIFFGYFLKRKGFLDMEWFRKGNKLIFNVCLPVMLFINVYNIPSFSAVNWPIVIYAQLFCVVIFSLVYLLVRFTIPDNRQKGVIWQCAYRSNFAIIGLSLSQALGGVEGVGLASVLSAFSIPCFNILGVISLSLFRKENGKNKVSVASLLKKIGKNPLIIGAGTGLFVLLIRTVLPVDEAGAPVFSIAQDLPFLFTAINNISKICTPLALIILGGLFDFSAIKGMLPQIFLGTALRLVITPGLGIGCAILLSEYTSLLPLGKSAFPALIALYASPVAVSSAIMAEEMDNDGVLAGQLVVWTSVFSIFTLFILVVLLRSLGYL